MTTSPETRNDTARMWAIVAFLAIVCVTVVGIYAVVPHSNNPGFVVTQILSFAAVAFAAIRGQYSADKARVEVEGARAEVGEANGKLDRVLNGEMDGKIERAVHKVLREREPIPAQVVQVTPDLSEHQGDDELDDVPYDTDERPDLRGSDAGPRP